MGIGYEIGMYTGRYVSSLSHALERGRYVIVQGKNGLHVSRHNIF